MSGRFIDVALLYADDLVIVADSAADLQTCLGQLTSTWWTEATDHLHNACLGAGVRTAQHCLGLGIIPCRITLCRQESGSCVVQVWSVLVGLVRPMLVSWLSSDGQTQNGSLRVAFCHCYQWSASSCCLPGCIRDAKNMGHFAHSTCVLEIWYTACPSAHGSSRLIERFADFAEGRWAHFLLKNREWADQQSLRAVEAPDTKTTSNADAEVLVQLGELSSRRNVLEGASLAPGFDASLRDLQDRAKRPLFPREPLSDHLFQRQEAWFDLDHRFAKNLRVAKRGAAGGLSGKTTDHLRPLSDSVAVGAIFLSRAVVFDEIMEVVRLGRLSTAETIEA